MKRNNNKSRWISNRLLGATLIATFALSAVWAQTPWVIRMWQSDVGLPDNTVVGLGQSPDGFLWVATPAGLVRFDGLQFRPYAPVMQTGMPSGLIQSLLVDSRGRLWVAKERGIGSGMASGQTAATVTSENGLPERETHLMVEDAEGDVWISYIGGEVVRLREGKSRVFTTADGLPGNGICELSADPKGPLWFAQGGWVGVFRDNRFCPLAGVPAQRIVAAREGGLWLCNGKRLFKYTEGGTAVHMWELPSWDPKPTPTALFEDRTGNVWIGTTEAGLFRFDRKASTGERLTEHQEILSIKEDRDENVWVGTRGGGLIQFKPRVVELQAIDVSFPFTAVRSICQDPASGFLWAIGQKGDASWRQGNGWSILSTNTGWDFPNAQCIAADPKGGLWIGTQAHGLHRWQDGQVIASLTATNGLSGDCVGALLPIKDGGLWIGSGSSDGQRQALQYLETGKFQTYALAAGSGPVVALVTDAAGDCWAATSKGLLLRVRQKVLRDETAATFAQPYAIRSLYATPEGSVWIGYGGQGLGRLKDGRFSRCRTDQGLHDDYLSQIISDGHGRLWFAGNQGIFSVREKELDELAAGRATRVNPVAYGQQDGLPRLQASHGFTPGVLRAKDGTLWFAMESGLALLKANELKENPEPPPVVIERLTVNGKIVAAYGAGGPATAPDAAAPVELRQSGVRVHLPPGQRQVEFVFTAPSFKMPESLGFRYRLYDLDKEWFEAGTRRTALYPHLPPGDYRFQVKACNSDGVWNETGAVLELTVEPYWWETVWFQVAAPLAIAGVVGSGVFVWVRRRRRFQIERLELLRATEKERVRIAQDLHDDLGAGLTEIGLLGDLAGSRAGHQPETASLISQRARELAGALDEIVWAVNPRHDNSQALTAYFCRFAQDFLRPAGIACRFDVADPLPEGGFTTEMRHQLFLAFKEALNNIVHHAKASEVSLRIVSDEGRLVINVSDNGCGFTSAVPAGSPDGLQGMRDRLARLGGECTVHSTAGKGVSVTFSLPINGGLT